jgi:hypothetical protein
VLKTPLRALETSPPRVHAQDIAARAIEPGDDDNFVAGLDVLETLKHLWLDDEPGLGAPSSA